MWSVSQFMRVKPLNLRWFDWFGHWSGRVPDLRNLGARRRDRGARVEHIHHLALGYLTPDRRRKWRKHTRDIKFKTKIKYQNPWNLVFDFMIIYMIWSDTFKEEFKWPVLKKRWGDALIWIHIRRSLGGQRQVWDAATATYELHPLFE